MAQQHKQQHFKVAMRKQKMKLLQARLLSALVFKTIGMDGETESQIEIESEREIDEFVFIARFKCSLRSLVRSFI